METVNILNRFSGEVIASIEVECAPDALPSFKLGLAVKAVIAKTKADQGVYARADLTDANLTRVALSAADLTDANLTRADLTDADLTRANLTRANLTDANLTRVALSAADLTDANLTRVALSAADLTRANLTRADLTDADLTRANLTRANLTRANLTRADLTDADLTDADLTDEQLRPFKADFFLTLSTLRASATEALHLIEKLRAGKINGHSYGSGNAECACLVGTIAQPRDVSGEALDHNSSRPAERWFMMINVGDKPEEETGGGYASRKALEWALEWSACHGIEVPAVETVA